MEFCTGRDFPLVDPALGAEFTTIRLSTVADVERAVTTARAAGSGWRRTGWDDRARLLRSTAKRIRDDVDAIAAVLTQEQGKTLKESRIETLRCADTFDFYADDAFDSRPEIRELDGKRSWVTKRPVGVVAAIVPWNFPLTLLSNKLVPALAAGNAVVVKPAQTTPLATRVVLAHLREAGLPEGVVTAVLGEADVGRALVAHPDVDMVSFTGSTETGRAIMAVAAGRVKRLALELGGSDALIVDADADLDGAAKATAIGRFFNCGQACIAVKRVFVHRVVVDEFVEKLGARVDRLVVGDGRTPGVLVGPQHTDRQRQHTVGLIDDAVDQGAAVLRGGGIPGEEVLQRGYFVEPTILTSVPENARLMKEESFGPVVPVIEVESIPEAVARANASEFGLGSSLWSRSPANIRMAIESLEAGYTWVNEIAIDFDGLPFGGVKQSGFGKERGRESIDEFRVAKSVVAPENTDVLA